MPELRLRDRILHATAGWHTTTDPACIVYRPVREGSRLDAISRGQECRTCAMHRLFLQLARVEREVRPPSTRIICPVCEARIPVPIHVSLEHFSDEPSRLVAEPDMTDVWAHAWTHNGGDDE